MSGAVVEEDEVVGCCCGGGSEEDGDEFDEEESEDDEAGRGSHFPAVPSRRASTPAFTAAAHQEPMMAYSLGWSFSCFALRRSTVRPQGLSPSTVYTTQPIIM